MKFYNLTLRMSEGLGNNKIEIIDQVSVENLDEARKIINSWEEKEKEKNSELKVDEKKIEYIKEDIMYDYSKNKIERPGKIKGK